MKEKRREVKIKVKNANASLVSKEMKSLLCLLLCLSFICCSTKSFETEKELWNYIKNPNNEYLKKKNIKGYNFSLLYKPTDLLVRQELSEKIPREERKQEVKKLRKKYSQYLYFSLSISKNGQELLSTTPKNRNEFGQMVNQLAFGMGNKVHLFTQKKDTIDLIDYNYPRMYGMGGTTTMLFVYPRNQKHLKGEYLNFIIEDLGMYTGEVKFKISLKEINNQPKIEF